MSGVLDKIYLRLYGRRAVDIAFPDEVDTIDLSRVPAWFCNTTDNDLIEISR